MGFKIFVPIDSTSLSLGADDVADLIAATAKKRNIDVTIIRNGSRGMFWLEPLVEVETDDGRLAYGPIEVNDVDSLFDCEFYLGGQHPKYLGPTEELTWLKKQERLTFARTGITDPLSIDDYIAHDGFNGLLKSLKITNQQIVDEVKESGLRGRGGAAFPTGIKWQTVLDVDSDQKYIVCNADEGDSGTYSDRMAMENDPFMLIEGMVIAGLAVNADHGYIYLRSEYPHALVTLNKAIKIAEENNYLGKNILNSGKHFNLEVRRAAGAYICGEETSLLESLEGKRGLVRYKPPLPAVKGLFQLPTVVNNVLSLAAVSSILADGAKAYRDLGTGRSRGTLTVQLGGNVKRGGLLEVPFGITLAHIVKGFGGGTATGRPVRAVQVGG